MNSDINYEAIQQRVGPDDESLFTDYDLVIDTVDNNKTRALINYFTQKHGIPFISGGTSHESGQVVTSVPGKTGCLDCQVDIDSIALAQHNPTSCIYAPEPSVITSNAAIGGLMVAELRHIDQPVLGIIKYGSREAYRLGLLPSAGPCHHDDWDGWMERMAHLYEVGP